MPAEMTEEQAKALQEKIKSMSPEELRQFQKQQCIFCQIVAGKVPAKKIYEDEHCIAVMDINPAARGHLLLLPKEHYAIMPQVPEKEMGHLFLVSKYLSQVLLKTLRVTGTTIFIANGLAAGQKAQHFLLHLIPRKEGDAIMPWEEKLVDATIQSKVQQLLMPRLNELMGIKKTVVQAEAKKTIPPPISRESKETELNREEQEKEELGKEERNGNGAEGAVEVAEQKPSRKRKKREISREKSENESPPTDNVDEAEKQDEQGVSLDDIARLFQ